MKKCGYLLVGILLLISLGANLSFLIGSRSPTSKMGSGGRVLQQLNYPLLSKRILLESDTDILINFLPLRTELRQLTMPYGRTFGLYFEYLWTGSSIGINEKDEFPAASLIKLPIAMAYYHQRERLNQVEDKEVEILENQIDSSFGDLWRRGPGAKINLSEAVKLALVESDNTAGLVVLGNTSEFDFEKVYDGLDVDLDIRDDGQVLISAKSFSSVLRALFFSSVLHKENSQHLLELLAKSTFKEGLVAGIPRGVPVAHKFGNITNQLLSDCGIVYPKSRAYMLCMISKGEEEESIRRMKEISGVVYKYVTSVNN